MLAEHISAEQHSERHSSQKLPGQRQALGPVDLTEEDDDQNQLNLDPS